mmetsp:Transcript_23954/g.95055  ORF Transcript_23954/g.95055 Transcript_23954/m.95055 type:complete len:84 (-) Transcript_23954:182-433(-)
MLFAALLVQRSAHAAVPAALPALLVASVLSLSVAAPMPSIDSAIWFGRNTRKPKKANHGKRPCCNVNRKAKKPRKGKKTPFIP